MLRIRKFGENSCGYNAALWNCCSILRGYATMSFRQGYAMGLSLTDRNFDRIELRCRARRKDEKSKRDRRNRADSVETLRTTNVVCVLQSFSKTK